VAERLLALQIVSYDLWWMKDRRRPNGKLLRITVIRCARCPSYILFTSRDEQMRAFEGRLLLSDTRSESRLPSSGSINRLGCETSYQHGRYPFTRHKSPVLLTRMHGSQPALNSTIAKMAAWNVSAWTFRCQRFTSNKRWVNELR
jgi:hypothetical protein